MPHRTAPLSLPRAALLAAVLAAAAPAQTPLFAPVGDHVGDAFGSAIAVVPDLDGDGLPDLLIGAPTAPGSGYVRTYAGTDGTPLRRLLTHSDADLFGFAVAEAGDTDNDGVSDLLVGSPGSDAAFGSNVQVFDGASGGMLLTIPGGLLETWDQLGHALAMPGDVDGDGFGDAVAGAPFLQGGQAGRVKGFELQAGSPILDAVGDVVGDQFGFSLAPVGDVDLDGVPDLLAGAPAGNYAHVLSGADGGLILHLPGAGGDFARAVAAAGDVNGDGTPDLAVGAPLFNRMDLLSGTDGALLARYEKFGGDFGSSLAFLGDTDEDGVPDMLVGAPADDVGGLAGAGTAFVISGIDGHNLFKFTGNSAGARLGSSAAAGDTDGDGAPEMLLGAPLQPTGEGPGAAALYDGQLAGSIAAYGIGCPGSFLITPRLDLYGDPLPDGKLTIAITNALGGAPAGLMFGLGEGNAPLSNGCILWVDPLVTTIAIVLDGGFPGEGNKTLVGRLPRDMPVGSTFSVQALILDEGTDGGVAGTSAFLVTVQ